MKELLGQSHYFSNEVSNHHLDEGKLLQRPLLVWQHEAHFCCHHIFLGPLRIYHKRAGWLVLSFKRHRRLPLLTASLFGKGLTKKTSHNGSKYWRCVMMHAPTITCAYFECIPGSGQIKFKVVAAPIAPSPIKPMRISVTTSFN